MHGKESKTFLKLYAIYAEICEGQSQPSFNIFVQIFEKPKMNFIIVNFQDGHSTIKNPIR